MLPQSSERRKLGVLGGRWVLTVSCYAFCLILSSPLGAQESDSVTYVPRQENLRQVAFVPARQACENWGFAAALQSVLEMQRVEWPQSAWVMKLSGTNTCGPLPGTAAELARAISGDYKLDNGRNFHVQGVFEDTYVDPGRLVRAVRENRPFLLIWRHRVFMVTGLRYVEEIHSSGIHRYDIRETRLLDPFAGAEQTPTTFEKKPESLKDVDGIIEVIATGS